MVRYRVMFYFSIALLFGICLGSTKWFKSATMLQISVFSISRGK